jgi:hypothetical protein
VLLRLVHVNCKPGYVKNEQAVHRLVSRASYLPESWIGQAVKTTKMQDVLRQTTVLLSIPASLTSRGGQ